MFSGLLKFYESLSKNRGQNTATEIKSFLSHIIISKLSEDKKNFVREILLKAKLSERDFTKEDSHDSLKCIQNDKSPGNDGLAKEFCETF